MAVPCQTGNVPHLVVCYQTKVIVGVAMGSTGNPVERIIRIGIGFQRTVGIRRTPLGLRNVPVIERGGPVLRVIVPDPKIKVV